MEHATYLLILLAAISVPFAFSFHPRLRFDKEWNSFFPAAALTAAPFIIWDVAFTRMGVWGFNPDYLCGFYVLGLPVEEWLFFLLIPYCCLYSYHCLKLLIPKAPGPRFSAALTLVLVLIFLVIGLSHTGRAYTFITFISMAGLLLCAAFLLRAKWLGMFYLSWGLMLLPFFIVNGMLTGSFLEAPVVWYDDTENLGIRLFTIPVEDTVYGMLLMLGNTLLFERFRKNRGPHPVFVGDAVKGQR